MPTDNNGVQMSSVTAPNLLLERGDDSHRPSLENRVAWQWESELRSDLIGQRTSGRRNRVVLGWLTAALRSEISPRALLDVGCAYGNHIFMCHSMMGKESSINFVGADISAHGFPFATAFAQHVPGYSNCSFRVADIESGLPFADAEFDAVNFSDILEHLEDPEEALLELRRVTKPGGTIVISTPLKNSFFKTAAKLANKLSGGRLYARYYGGKGVKMENGSPIMDVHAGHDHISEMTFSELIALCRKSELTIEAVELMPIMSGSAWFDEHAFLLAGILLLEAIHDVLKLPSWAHSVCLKLKTPNRVGT